MATPALDVSDNPASETLGPDACELIAFTIDGEVYGVDIRIVREIRAWSGATPMPNTAAFVRGVMNLRGAVIPIIDMRARFGRALTDPTPTHVVVVIAIEGKWVGLLVDAVSDIVSVRDDQIQAAPDTGDTSLFRGVAALDDQMIALIDIERLLSGAIEAFE